MRTSEIRKRFLSFFIKRGHKVVPSASLVPENDPSVLFTTAGMQPLVPYLMWQDHPYGKRLVNIQKCMRTNDIDEVGDSTHLTFFEMMGNWSLGDYFKKEALTWSYEFLTDKEEGLGLDPSRLYVTVFEGNENAPRDDESAEIWKSLGVPGNRIYFLGSESNWWSPGDNGPCGPDSEMFYDVTEEGLGDMTKEEYLLADNEQKVVEVWNNVFMEYEKKDGRVVGKLARKNVDTGSGLERVAMVTQKKDNIFETDIFKKIIDEAKLYINDIRKTRVIADHIRASVMIIAEGVAPSNTDRGYILRRLLRRAIVKSGIDSATDSSDIILKLADVVIDEYGAVHEEIEQHRGHIKEVIKQESEKFTKTLARGLKEFDSLSKSGNISGVSALSLSATYGFPFELTLELAREKHISVDEEAFWDEMKKHKEISRKGAERKFKGGLADMGEETTMLHTATHLMLAGLRKYLGDHIHQAGSNITAERTRFDFTHPEKVPRDILDKVESYVNFAIKERAAVTSEKMPKDKARAEVVEGSFWEKYPETVNVYTIKNDDGVVYSRELCGGPHMENAGDIKGDFKIKKEESSSSGVRRVKAVLE